MKRNIEFAFPNNFLLLSVQEQRKYFDSLSEENKNDWLNESVRQRNEKLFAAYMRYLLDEGWYDTEPDRYSTLVLPSGLIIPKSLENYHNFGISCFFRKQKINVSQKSDFAAESSFLDLGGMLTFEHQILLDQNRYWAHTIIVHDAVSPQAKKTINILCKYVIASHKNHGKKIDLITVAIPHKEYFFEPEVLDRVPFSLMFASHIRNT